MRLTTNQIEAIKHETEPCFGACTGARRFGSRVDGNQRGFTLVELIMTMVILGIISAVAIPRFFGADVFKSRGFADQVQASLRYAQKVAIAQHRLVCVALASTSVTLTIASTSAAGTCTLALAFPAGGNSITAPSGVKLSPAVTINFDALGRAAAKQTITVSGATNSIVVEAETGYVHQ